MEITSNRDAVLRLQDITKRLLTNDSNLAHFEPLPQLFSKQQEDPPKTMPQKAGHQTDRLKSPAELASNRQLLAHPAPLSTFAIQLTSFSLFENEDFQKAFRTCLEALSRTEDEDIHDSNLIEHDSTSSQKIPLASFGETCRAASVYTENDRRFVNPTTIELKRNFNCESNSRDVHKFSIETIHLDCVSGATEIVDKTHQDTVGSFSCAKVKYRKNSNIKKVTLRALPEPDLRLALDAVSSLCNLQDLQIINSPQSQCLSIQTLTRVLVSLHRSKHRGHGGELPCNATPSLQRTTRKLPNRENGINTNGGLRRLNITTRIQAKTQVQLEELALGLRLHSSTLEYINLHILPRCSSIESPNMNLNSVLKALSSSPGGRSNMLGTCRIVLGYDHNPFGKPLIKPSTLHQVLTSCTRLRRLQLDNFGLTDDHIRVVTNIILSSQIRASTSHGRSKFKLELQELQLARNQYHYYHHGPDRLQLPSNGVKKDLSARVFTPEAVDELCQAVFASNFTLHKLCILTADEMYRLDETNFSSVSEKYSYTGCTEYLVNAQRTLNMYTRMNQLGRFRLYNTDSEAIQPWLEALSAAANGSNLLSDAVATDKPSFYDYDDCHSNVLHNRNTKQYDENAFDGEIVSVIYSLLRSNPAIILPVIANLNNSQHCEVPPPQGKRIDLSTVHEESELVSACHCTLHASNSDHLLLKTNPIPSRFVMSESNRSPHAVNLPSVADTLSSMTHRDSSCIMAEQRSALTLPQLNRTSEQQQHVKGWLRTLGNSLNHRAVDIIKRLDIRAIELSEKQINKPLTEKSSEKNCDAFCDTTEEDDDTISDHEALLFGASSSIEFDDEDSLSRYKSNTAGTPFRRRGARKRSSFGIDKIKKTRSSTGKPIQQDVESVRHDGRGVAVWEVTNRIPPPLLTSSRNEVHPIRFVLENRNIHRQEQRPSPGRGIPKWSSY
jgi:hypothetical protein